MLKNCAQYIAEAKWLLGPRTTDGKLGDAIGYAQQTVQKAKAGQMSDGVALAVGELLKKHGVIEHAGEVLLVAHAERDADPRVRKTLLDYAKNVVSRASSKAAALSIGAAVMLGLAPSHDVQAAGGSGRY